MFGKLVLLFILVPMADLFLLMVLSSYTGWPFSITMVVLSGIVGAWLAKRSYKSVLNKFRSSAINQQLSTELLTDGALVFFAGGLLLTPGFITDTVGLTLLIPRCRRWYKARLTQWFKRNFKFQMVPLDGQREMFENESFETGVVDGEVLQPPLPSSQRLEL